MNILPVLKALLLVFTLLLSACSATKSVLKTVGLASDNALATLSVESVYNSNRNTPVAVDVVFISDENITPLLSPLSGPEWFNQKTALIKRYANELDLVSLEVVPLSYLDNIALPSNHKNAKNILLFANYRSADGQYVAELSHLKTIKIRLLRDSYELVE